MCSPSKLEDNCKNPWRPVTTKLRVYPTSQIHAAVHLIMGRSIWKEVPWSITPKEELTERWTCKIYSPPAGTFIEDWLEEERLFDVRRYRQKTRWKEIFGGEELMTRQRWKRLREQDEERRVRWRQGLKLTAARCQVLVNVTFDG